MKKSLTLMFVLLSSAFLQAEPTKGGQTLNWIGEFDHNSAQYTYYLQKVPSLGFGVEVSHLSDYLAPDGDAWMGFAQARLEAANGRWRNFIFGGLGANRTHNQGDALIEENIATSWAAQLGLGTDFYLTDHLFMGLEIRDTILDHRYKLTTEAQNMHYYQGDHEVVNILGLYLRVGVKWGGSK